jgi:hypothetical protein
MKSFYFFWQNFIIWQQKERSATLTKDFLEKNSIHQILTFPCTISLDYSRVSKKIYFALYFIAKLG